MSDNEQAVQVQYIKEIYGNKYSYDDIYETLRECSWDPVSALDKLQHRDTYHEVGKKHGKKEQVRSGVHFAESSSGQAQSSLASRAQPHHRVNSVYVRNLPPNVTEKEVSDAFSRFGSVVGVQLLKDKYLWHGFIDFESYTSVQEVVQVRKVFVAGHRTRKKKNQEGRYAFIEYMTETTHENRSKEHWR